MAEFWCTVVLILKRYCDKISCTINKSLHQTPDGEPACTWNGICIAKPGTEEVEETSSPPSISLVGPERIEIFQGSQYSQCPEEAPVTLLCDSGATAVDAADGKLTTRIEMCSTDEHQILFTSNIPLLIACRIDPNIPGEYPINYSVTNSKRLRSAVTRILAIKPVCPPGEHLCDNLVRISGYLCTFLFLNLVDSC